MRLLFDQNISFRLVNKLSEVFPDTKQVRQLGLENATDLEIWSYAKKYDFTIVTFDSDFCDISNLKGFPPKIIWLRFGNTTTDKLAEILSIKAESIKAFINSPENKELACLEVSSL
ncbi:MAG: DUF5615 family PIN-like protein [Bacteroidota bacterium]